MLSVDIEENISINLYVITSFIFNLISFYLLFSLKDKNLNRSHNYGWIVFKMTIFTVSFLLTLTCNIFIKIRFRRHGSSHQKQRIPRLKHGGQHEYTHILSFERVYCPCLNGNIFNQYG
jgi:hypothetical protein